MDCSLLFMENFDRSGVNPKLTLTEAEYKSDQLLGGVCYKREGT